MPFCTNCGLKLGAGGQACPRCGAWDYGVPPGAWSPPSAAYPPPYGLPPPDLTTVQTRVSQAFEQLIHDIRSFNFKWVVPIDMALSPEFIGNRSVWVMLVFGFFPLVAAAFEVVQTAEGFVRLLEIYFALAWAGYFYYFVACRSTDLRLGAAVAMFTAVVGVSLVLLLQTLPGLSWLYAGLPGGPEGLDPVRNLIGFLGGVGPVEECCKALPVLLVAFLLGRVQKPMDGMFLGAMSGLGFAVSEGTRYIMQQGNVWQVLIRGTSLPFLHALWAGIAGYFIALAVINRSRAAALIVSGLLVSICLHGLYDFAGGVVSVLLCAFTYLLFVSYMERSQTMVADLQAAERAAEEHAKMQAVWLRQYGQYAMPSALTGWPPPPGGSAPR